jgi:hypothetical protein
MIRRIEHKSIYLCLVAGATVILSQITQQYNPFFINSSGAMSKPELENNCPSLSIEAEVSLVNVCLGYVHNRGTSQYNACCLQIQKAYR